MNEEVPDGWSLSSLSSLANYHNGRAFKPEEWSKAGLPILRIAQINNPSANTDYYDGKDVLEEHLVNPGDLLFSWSATLKAVIWKHQKSILNQHIFKVEPNEGISKIFLQQLIDFSLDKLAESSHGSTMKHIKKGVLNEFHVAFPPLPEQKKIASILTSVDEVIENTQKQIDKLQDLKKATMNELLTKGIDHTEFKDSELGRIPKSWQVKEISECCEILDSKRIPLNSEERANRKGIYPYYGANGIQDYIDDFIFDGDAILLAEDGGNFHQYADRPIAQWVTGKYWVNNHAHILRARGKKVENKWVYYSLVHKNILKYINGGTRAKLNQSDLRKIEIPFPPVEEQNRVTAIFTSIDEVINEKKQELIKKDFLKKSLMQDLLTGKVRVQVN